MKKVKIMENLYAFVQDSETELHSNTYLLVGNPNILIDAGFLPKEKIGMVLLTHCHVDHTIFCKELNKSGAKIAIGAKDSKELERNTEIRQPVWAKEEWGESQGCKPDFVLKKGDLISNTNFMLQTIECPGHTPGAVAFFDKRRNIIFSGDTWYGGETIGSWQHPGGNFEELKDSVQKLKTLDAKILCSGHGAAKWKNKK